MSAVTTKASGRAAKNGMPLRLTRTRVMYPPAMANAPWARLTKFISPSVTASPHASTNSSIPYATPSKMIVAMVSRALWDGSVFELVDIGQARFRKRLAHLIHVQSQLARGQAAALVVLVGDAFCRRGRDFGGAFTRHHDDTVVIGDDDVARTDRSAGTDDGNIHRAERRLHSAFGRYRARPDREA